jgi:hypothetical protein
VGFKAPLNAGVSALARYIPGSSQRAGGPERGRAIMPSGAGNAILAEYYTLLLLALFHIAVRTYVRFWITKGNFQSWSWDDTTIILAWVSSLLYEASIHREVLLIRGRTADTAAYRRSTHPD